MLPPDIISVLGHYPRQIDIQAVVSATRHTGFSGADVWKLTTPGGSFALRRWAPSGQVPAERLRGLHRLLEHVRRCGVEFVAVPLRTDAGETLLFQADQYVFWQLEPWLPGTADYHAHPHETRLRAALAALARWHQAAATFVPAEDVRRWFVSAAAAPSPAVRERLQRLLDVTPGDLATWNRELQQSAEGEQRTLSRELARQIHWLHPLIAEELQALQHERFALQPCLRDIWHDHVLFAGDEVTGLIDASACRTEHVATDLSRLIGSLVEDDANGWRIALEAYRQHRTLSLAEEALVRALDRSGVVLGALTWLKWLYQTDRRFEEPKKVLERLCHFQRRLATMESRFAF